MGRRKGFRRLIGKQKARGEGRGLSGYGDQPVRYRISGAESTKVLVLFFSAFAFSEQPAPSA